jgi:hypothetical protein
MALEVVRLDKLLYFSEIKRLKYCIEQLHTRTHRSKTEKGVHMFNLPDMTEDRGLTITI